MLKRDINNSVFIDDGRNHFLRIHFYHEFSRQNKMNASKECVIIILIRRSTKK